MGSEAGPVIVGIAAVLLVVALILAAIGARR